MNINTGPDEALNTSPFELQQLTCRDDRWTVDVVRIIDEEQKPELYARVSGGNADEACFRAQLIIGALLNGGVGIGGLPQPRTR